MKIKVPLRSAIVIAALPSLFLPFFLASASSLAPVELEGVNGAKLSVHVSHYLPGDADELESKVTTLIRDRFAETGLSEYSEGDQYLSVDISGDVLRTSLCPSAILIEIEVQYSEPLFLRRNGREVIAGSPAVWSQTMVDVVPTEELVDTVLEYVDDMGNDFCLSVRSVNQDLNQAGNPDAF